MTRTDLINKAIKAYGYKSYLEIGVQKGINIRAVNCLDKTGVDPEPQSNDTTHIMTSDDFFKTNNRTFDCVFIDGLHEADQVYKDIVNALEVLNDGGTILCHDMNPTSEGMQKVPRVDKVWTGDCWKAWVKLRQERNDLSMFVVNTDFGVGVIRKGKQKKLSIKQEITYENFSKFKNNWLHLISTSDIYSYEPFIRLNGLDNNQ